MGRRSRKARRASGPTRTAGRAGVATKPAESDAAPRPSRTKRNAARNEAIRDGLEPLKPGQRPGAVTAAAVVAALLGVINVIGWAAGFTVNGHRTAAGGAIAFAFVMFTAAVGMWRARYWAVLGFQALLAIITLVFALFLVRASNWWAVLVCVVVIGGAGTLFWRLVRAMARIQMPNRRPAS